MIVAGLPRRRPRPWLAILGQVVRTPRGAAGLGLAGFVVAVAISGPAMAPHSAQALLAFPFGQPSAAYPFGADFLGRDVLSRVLDGGWVLLLMAVSATVLGLAAGATAGISAAYLRGPADGLIMRTVDVILAFPQLVFALLLLSILGPQCWLIVLAAGLTHAPAVARVIRAATLDIAARDYVKAAELQGMRPAAVMAKEILPSLSTPLMVEAGLRLTYSIIIMSGLAFLGFGQPPPAANWGMMINENRAGLALNPWAVIIPAAMIALLTIGTNLLTDAIGQAAIGADPPRRTGRAANWTVQGDGEAGRPPEAPSKHRLEVRDLEISSGRHGPAVVSGISFAVRPGAVLGLVGESGSGKTTVALALLGHTRRGLTMTGGHIWLDGTDLRTLKPAQLRALRGAMVSYLPQDPAAALNPALRVGYQLREVLKVHPESSADPAARIREVLHEVSLGATPDLLHRYPHQLSGGQQQRVGLAMAFACRPALIVLDEPTTGLDVSTQRRILNTVRQLCRGYGVAAVYVSHDLAVVSELADQVAVMYAGRIVETGPAAGLFAQPLHPYTRGLLAAVPEPDRAGPLAGIPGQPPPPGQRGPGCAFAARCELVLDQCRQHEPELAPAQPNSAHSNSAHSISAHSISTQPNSTHHISTHHISTHTLSAHHISAHTVRCWRAAEASAEQPGPSRPAPAVVGPEPAALLSVRGVSARYRGVTALSGIDLDLPAPGCLAVVGESGSGKTTLARCITGLQQDWTGEVTLRGDPLARAARHRPKQVLKQIQYVFQNPYTSLNPRKTVGQIVAEPVQRFLGLSRGEQADRVAQVLSDVALGGRFLSRYPDQLSGGERQRVAIARALAAEPDVLICDEVTSALDVSVQAVIVELLRAAAAQRQLAMVFITHNLALVRSVAQTTVVLRHGQIVEAGPAGQILDQPGSEYTAQLLADAPRLARPRAAGRRWV